MDVVKPESGENIRVNMLVYGVTGVGKTTLLGSAQDFPLTSPALMMDVDGGALSLSGSEIDIVRPRSFAEIQEIYEFLYFENTEYRSVCIDSLTEIQRKLSMGEILGDLEEDTSYGHLDTRKPPDRYDWLSSGEQMRKFIRAFKDLAYLEDESRRIHVFFSASEKSDEGRSIVCPSLPGLLGAEVGGSVDILARLSVERVLIGDSEEATEVRKLALRRQTDDDGKHYLAKVRIPPSAKFPDEMINPTVEKLVNRWIKATAAVKGGGTTKPRRSKNST